jgi:hypothetical protein
MSGLRLVSHRTEENSNYNIALSIINHEFKTNEIKKNTRMKVHKVLAIPVFSYGSEA